MFRMRCGESTMGRDNVYVEWEPTEADRKRALANHGQTLERLNERGGMSWCEMAAILGNRDWRPMDQNEAKRFVYAEIATRSAPADAQGSNDGGK